MDSFISVFEGRLLTLEDEENFHFHDVGIVEYDLFVKNLTKFGDELKVEINEALKLQYALASDLGVLQKFFLLIESYIATLVNNYSANAISLLTNKLLEINTKNTEDNKKIITGT